MCGRTVSISGGVVVPVKGVVVVGVSILLLNGVVLSEGVVEWCTRGKGVIELGPLPTRILPEILSKCMHQRYIVRSPAFLISDDFVRSRGRII